jgi:hypothetical protein
MTQPDFVRRLDAALIRHGVAVKQTELLAWVEATWLRIQQDPDAGRWAGEFIQERAARRERERSATSEPEQLPRAGHDHTTRLVLVVVTVLALIVLWETHFISRILRALGL